MAEFGTQTDASFVSPDGSRVACTLAATAPPDAKIRLSDSGTEHPEELQRIE